MSPLLSVGLVPANTGSAPSNSVNPGIASAAAPIAVDLKKERRFSVDPAFGVFMVFCLSGVSHN
jgi:hypothetical protein